MNILSVLVFKLAGMIEPIFDKTTNTSNRSFYKQTCIKSDIIPVKCYPLHATEKLSSSDLIFVGLTC